MQTDSFLCLWINDDRIAIRDNRWWVKLYLEIIMVKHKVFENVTITFKGSKEPLTLPHGFYDFFITDGVITVVCFDSMEKHEIVAAKIYNPNEIKLIEVW